MIEGHSIAFIVAFSIICIVLIIAGLLGLSYIIGELVEDISAWRRRKHETR